MEGAIRLALFDEAFNKMDDTRIGTALTFFRRPAGIRFFLGLSRPSDWR